VTTIFFRFADFVESIKKTTENINFKIYRNKKMQNVTIRKGNKVFSDSKQFPYGFKKSGDFSIAEANMLSTYGDTLFNLEFGSLLPENEEETRFVGVVRGECEAQSLLEKTWLKYVKLARTRRNFYTMHSTRAHDTDVVEDVDYDGSDLEIEA
jgi:uncharacterized protein YifE (UPF0438 family)